MLKVLISLVVLASIVTSKTDTKAQIKSSAVDIVVKTAGQETLNR